MKKKLFAGILLLLCICLLLVEVVVCERGHVGVEVTEEEFMESSMELKNPNCGFYYMHGFYITEEDMDFRYDVAKRFCADENTALTMIQINLAYFKDRELSEQGLKNIDSLFETLRTVDKQLVVRFLYDWDGNCKGKEPEDLKIILRHMEQIGPVVAKYSDRIYTLQGLFIGNWGEMNGTSFTGKEDIKMLVETLFHATEGKVYLAVRMPMFWRRAVEQQGTVCENGVYLEERLGLYNDGMLGSFSDYGTYGNSSKKQSGRFEPWNRQEELAFQNRLCKWVPQGGEVIIDNDYNDLENAIADFSKMHISYLNRDFDRNVYNKWKTQICQTEDCFDGMDGLTYMERHIGYRPVIEKAAFSYDMLNDQLKMSVSLKNVGFAPVYKKTDGYFFVVDTTDGSVYRYPVDVALSLLPGIIDKDARISADEMISLTGLKNKEYHIYFGIWDVDTKTPIMMANEQELTEFGYRVGTLHLQ